MTANEIRPDSLSNGDEKILNSVFDPENSPDTPTVAVDPALPPDLHIHDLVLLKKLRSRELSVIQLVEESSIPASSRPNTAFTNSSNMDTQDTKTLENETFAKVEAILSTLIEEYPKYASAYNNRAQLRRSKHGAKLIQHGRDDQIDSIVKDLDAAISLATPPGTNNPVSPSQAKLLSQAWTQRGAVLWSLSKSGRTWREMDKMQLEEEGSRSFFMAGMYGSEIGRNMAVKTNPYARLCAGIVKEAMKNEFAV